MIFKIHLKLGFFKNLSQKKESSFIVFDIINYYPSISVKLLNAALDWAKEFTHIDKSDRKYILDARKSLLYFNGSFWIKKENPEFDVTMGSFDGAEVCDLCSLFL